MSSLKVLPYLPAWPPQRAAILSSSPFLSHPTVPESQAAHPCLAVSTESETHRSPLRCRVCCPGFPAMPTFYWQDLVSGSLWQRPSISHVHSSLLRNLQGPRFPQHSLLQACYLLALALIQETPLFRSLWRERRGSARQDVGVLGSVHRCFRGDHLTHG